MGGYYFLSLSIAEFLILGPITGKTGPWLITALRTQLIKKDEEKKILVCRTTFNLFLSS